MQKDKLFPAQEESEKILRVIRRHWFTYFIFWFIGLMLSIPLILTISYLVVNFEEIESIYRSMILIGLCIYLLLILGLMIYGFIDYYLDIYIITDRRIVDIKQNGFFRRSISELNLRQVQDVNARVNGFFPTILHFGDVYIQTAGERENFEFISVPHPYETSKQILDIHELYLKSLELDQEIGENLTRFEDELKHKNYGLYKKALDLNSAREKELLEGINKGLKEQ